MAYTKVKGCEEERELRFDSCQFDPDFGARKAGTVKNNAMPATWFKRSQKEGLDFEAALLKAEKIMRTRGCALDKVD